MGTRRGARELLIHIFFLVVGASGIIILTLILLFLIMEGIPIFEVVSVKDFILGTMWYPTYDPPDFGILPLIAGSASVVVLSSLIAIPLGIGSAVYLAEIAHPRVRAVVKPAIELIEGLPTVVIGFFGMVVVAPYLQKMFGLETGLNLFNASVMLAFMAVPTIASISEDAIYSVPVHMKEGSMALGATHWETIARVILPASLTGISTAVILGIARAIGETMVVLMVAGGAAMIPESIFDPVRPMPANIAAEMGHTPFRSDHYHALFAIGLVLFVFTFLFNMIAAYLAQKHKQVGAASL
ncbi:MAG: phosphate ABC transporter permease subunit PstC [Desulfosalsimonadaceae bacterium]